MKNKKGFTIVELLSVIVILGIVITIGIFSVSSIRNTILDKQYKNVKKEIELAAEKYYSDTESGEVFVDTLVKEGYLKADNKSMIISDPRDKSSLNCHIVTINDDEEATLSETNNALEDGNCNESVIINSEISIVDSNGNKINDTWYKNPISLKVKFNSGDKDPNSYSYTWKSEKNPNSISSEMIYSLQSTYEERGKVIDDEYYATLSNSSETIDSKGQRVRIDGVLPEIKSLEIPDKDKWTKDKTLKANLTDIGSGIERYILSSGNCSEISLDNYNKITSIPNPNDVNIEYKITSNGSYSFCVSDKAGNIKQYEDIIVIDRIDDIPPECSYIENTSWTKNNVIVNFGCKDSESGCNKLTYNKKITNCSGTTCYNNYTYKSTYKTANINSTIGSFKIEDNAGNITNCPSDKKEVNVYLDKTNPIISGINATSTKSGYNSRYTKVSFTLEDSHSGISSFCIGTSKNNCSTKNINTYCTLNGNKYNCIVDYTFSSRDGSGNTEYVYITAYDNVGNTSTQSKSYKLYKSCTFAVFDSFGECSNKCGNGKYYENRTDKYLNVDCSRYGNNSCKTETYLEYKRTGSCESSCGTSQKKVYYTIRSSYDDSSCGTYTETESCTDYSDCYEPDPEPDHGGGSSSGGGSDCTYINGYRCYQGEKIYIRQCCPNGYCDGNIPRSSLTASSGCTSGGGSSGGSSGGGSSGGSSGGGSSSGGSSSKNCEGDGKAPTESTCRQINFGAPCCRGQNGKWRPLDGY